MWSIKEMQLVLFLILLGARGLSLQWLSTFAVQGGEAEGRGDLWGTEVSAIQAPPLPHQEADGRFCSVTLLPRKYSGVLNPGCQQ